MIPYTDKISPAYIKAGIVKDKDKINFVVKNQSEFSLESYKQECGCLGICKLSDREFSCELVASAPNCNAFVLWTDGTRYLQQVDIEGAMSYFDIQAGGYLDTIPAGLRKVQALKFEKTLPIRFKDGETDQIIQNGRLMDNPKRHKAEVTVTYFIIKE